MHALDRRELRDALRLKPVEELRRRARIGAARVRVPDLRREEFEEAIEARDPDAAMRAGALEAKAGTSWVMGFLEPLAAHRQFEEDGLPA